MRNIHVYNSFHDTRSTVLVKRYDRVGTKISEAKYKKLKAELECADPDCQCYLDNSHLIKYNGYGDYSIGSGVL